MSKVAIVTYRVLKENLEENKKYIEAVFEHLEDSSPADVKYASTIADDRLTFTHIAYFTSDEGRKALTESDEFKEFQANLASRCEILPEVKICDIVGSFNLF